MQDSALASPTHLLLAVLAGNLQFLTSTLGPALGLALQFLSFISLVLIIIVNWRKINSSSEKSLNSD